MIARRSTYAANPGRSCVTIALATAYQEALQLLTRRRRGDRADHALLQAATTAWELASCLDQHELRCRTGLLLARVHLVLGRYQLALVQARRVQRLVRGQADAVTIQVAADAIIIAAWRAAGNANAAEHVETLAITRIESLIEPVQREQCHWLLRQHHDAHDASTDPASIPVFPARNLR